MMAKLGKAIGQMNWKTFDQLSRDYKVLQIEILKGVCFDDFGPKALIKWGDTLIPALTKAHMVIDHDEAYDPLDVAHWSAVRDLAFTQLCEIMSLLEDSLHADEIGSFDKALVFNFVNRVSSNFHEVAQVLKNAEGAKTKSTLEVTKDQLEELIQFANG